MKLTPVRGRLRLPALLVALTGALLTTTLPAYAAALEPQPNGTVFSWADERIRESSGLATSSDGTLVYTVGDAEDEPAIFAVDARGKTQFRVVLPPGSNVDWEDLARITDKQGRNWIYVADTGDAYALRLKEKVPPRRNFAVLRFREPDTSSTGDIPPEALETLPLVFDDPFTHNVESMLVTPEGEMFFIDKIPSRQVSGEDPSPAGVWTPVVDPIPGAPTMLEKVAEVDVVEASGAAVSQDGSLLAVRNGSKVYLWTVDSDRTADAFLADPVTIRLPAQQQGEAVTFHPELQALLISTEGQFTAVKSVALPEGLVQDVSAPPTAEEKERAVVAEGPSSAAVALIVLVSAGSAVAVTAVIAVLLVRRKSRRDTKRTEPLRPSSPERPNPDYQALAETTSPTRNPTLMTSVGRWHR